MSSRGIRKITVAGGNLFQIASQYLGDWSQWSRIADLNGLSDFLLTGVTTLLIPPVNKNAGSGGIPGI